MYLVSDPQQCWLMKDGGAATAQCSDKVVFKLEIYSEPK